MVKNSKNKMASNKASLLSDEKNYQATLQTYLQYMQQLPEQREWMKEKFGMKIRDMFTTKREIRVLAVGTGTGEVDIDFLNELVQCGKAVRGDDYKVYYQVVEPNPSSLAYFRNVVKQKTSYKNITFNWFQGYFEKFTDPYRAKKNRPAKFDVAHFVRCFYHIDSVKALDTTYKFLLNKNGFVAVLGENKEAFWPRMMNFLAEHKMRHECFTCSGPVSQAYFLPGWISQATKNDWKYESYVKGYDFDVTPIYDPNSIDGNRLIDFALHAKDSRKVFSKDIMDDFFKFVDAGKLDIKLSAGGKEVKKTVYPCEMGAIMITKK